VYNIFFDSWGNGWIVCDPSHIAAQAFGPTGCAHRINLRIEEIATIVGDDGWVYADV
jgi:hypothetical protein